jgi:hypothetical protein
MRAVNNSAGGANVKAARAREVNFINILRTAFPPISFGQKIQMQNLSIENMHTIL